MELTYFKQGSKPVGDAGDPYNGYDRFGRSVDLRWQKTTSGKAQLDRLQYGFDRDSRRTWRQRPLTTGEDNAYGYDGLSQVTQATLGNLNLNAVPAQEEAPLSERIISVERLVQRDPRAHILLIEPITKIRWQEHWRVPVDVDKVCTHRDAIL